MIVFGMSDLPSWVWWLSLLVLGYTTAPRTWIPGELVTASMMNTIRDLFLDIAAGNSSGIGALWQSFQGLSLRTHPDADLAATQVMLTHADEIVMSDGTRVANWDNLVADITAIGAGGLDTGSEASSAWYSIHAIRKSSDGAKALLLHRAKAWTEDQSQTTDDGTGSSPALRYDSSLERLGQSFQAALSGPLPFVDVKLARGGTVSGHLWFTIEADSGGAPSGTPLATSDKIDASLISTTAMTLRVPFRAPATVTSSTTYWLVARGDYTVSTSNYITWLQKASGNPYANGTAATFNGSSWTNSTNKDHWFKTYVTQHDAALTMPSGYDQHATVGWVFNNSGGHFNFFRQLDRDVEMYSQPLNGVTATSPTLTDLSAVVPPSPITITQAIVRIDGTPGSHGILIGTLSLDLSISNGSIYYVCQFSTAWWTTSAVLGVPFQSFLYQMIGGTGYFYINRWRW